MNEIQPEFMVQNTAQSDPTRHKVTQHFLEDLQKVDSQCNLLKFLFLKKNLIAGGSGLVVSGK